MSRFQAASSSPSGAGESADEPLPPEQEAIVICQMMDGPLVAGEFWCVIECEWWRAWKAYVGYDVIREQLKGGGGAPLAGAMADLSLSEAEGGSGGKVGNAAPSSPSESRSSTRKGGLRSPSSGIRPYRINNRPLLGETNHELAKNITQNQHYILVPRCAWDKLVGWYGGGPELARKVVAQGEARTLIVELHPARFRVVRADVDGNPIQIEESDLADPSSGDYQCLYFNKNSTPAAITAATCAAFKVFKHASRLWVSQTLDSDDWRLMGSKESVSDLCAGGEEACLMLECKSEDTGAFPRDVAVVKAAWRDDIKVGDTLDAQDHEENKWYESRVESREGSKIKVHFMGWQAKFDEDFDISLEPARLMPLNTKVKFWRDFRVNDIVEMRRWARMGWTPGRSAHEYDWQLVKIDSLDRDARTLTVYFKKDPAKDRVKYTVGFDSEEIMWKGCHTKTSYWDRRNNTRGGGDTAGAPRGGPGVVGLQNLGNTCFMNSMLQCLSNCEPVTKHFLEGTFEDDLNTDNPLGMGGRMAECYAALLQRMWSGEVTVCRPSGIKKLIGEKAPHFQGYQQQDSSEFMNYLLDGLHEDLNLVHKKPYVEEKEADGRPDSVVAAERWGGFRKRNDSFIVDQFFGLARSEVRCDHPDCTRVSVTFDPQRAFMLPLPAVLDMMVKVTFVFADPKRPVTRFGVSVPKQGEAVAVNAWLAEKTGVAVENIFLCNYSKYNHKISTMVNLDDKNTEAFRYYNEIYAYEVLPKSDFAPIVVGGKDGEGKDEPEKDANGYYVGLKCRCRWNEMRFKFYDCTVTAIYVDPDDSKLNTYDVLFDEDQDTNLKAPLERMAIGRVEKSKYDRWNKPSLMQLGFHGENLEREDGRITVEMVHRTAKPPSVYSHTPVKGLMQWPLVLSMRRNITGDQLHNLVWAQVDRFVTPAVGWNRYNLPYVLRKATGTSAERTGNEIGDAPDLVDLKDKEVIIVDWSAEGMKTGFDVSAVERREDDASMPGRGGDGPKAGLSVRKCFEAFQKEEQLGENDKWHCSECRKADREPFRQAFKKMSVYRTGEILVLHLKRFVFEAGFSASFVHREKIESRVDYPVDGLDLTGIVQESEAGVPPVYDLFAVSNHSGGLGGGHYTAYGKNFNSGKWYMFNDSSTHEVQPGDVVTPQAYVLFYKRRVPAGLASRRRK